MLYPGDRLIQFKIAYMDIRETGRKVGGNHKSDLHLIKQLEKETLRKLEKQAL